MLAEGRNAYTEMPKNRFNYSAFHHPYPEIGGDFINHKGGHYLDQDIEEFDAGFFGVSRLEAEAFDPQQRLVLEASWEAVENAGIPLNKFRGSNTSVYGMSFLSVLILELVSVLTHPVIISGSIWSRL